MKRIEVHKFGGTSVAGAERMAAVAALVADALTRAHVVVVASAMSGVTDALVRASDAAAHGDGRAAAALVAELRSRHEVVLARLTRGDVTPVLKELARITDEVTELLSAGALLREVPPRTRDRVLSAGEKLAVRLLAAALRERGVVATPLDADTFLETDATFGEAQPLAGVADRTIAAALRPYVTGSEVAVVTGFCGRAPDGATTILGRGGSDYSATLVAGVLEADEVTIWTDVDGVFTADPGIIPEARLVRHLNYREAAELSFYGAKVLHQRTMIPVVTRGIAVRVRNSMNPSAEGTLVDARFTPGSQPVKALSAVRGQALVSVEGKGMAGVPGIASRTFGALAALDISVTMISQSSSESTICFALPAAHAERAEAALKRELRPELVRGDVEDVEVVQPVGLVAAVGLGMANHPGVAGRIFTALGRRGVNVLAIAQGSSELNITLALDERDVPTGLRALHAELGLSRLDTGVDTTGELHLLLLGCGNIGRALVALIERRRSHVQERFGLVPRIVALADRSGYRLRPTGIDAAELQAALAAKAEGRPLAMLEGTRRGTASAMLEDALTYRLARPILVDVSDADGTAEAFHVAFRLGCDVVTANKKPLAGPYDELRALLRDARASGRLFKAEATVGAGLPVVDTLEMLLATGDRPTRIEGVLSGTLAFVTSRLEAGERFSDAVAEAVRRGYTEPDPVVDLAGTDVARKATILGRLSGLVDTDVPVALAGLVDPALAGLPLPELLERLRAYDAPLAARVARARDAGGALRYVARVSAGVIEVGPLEVAGDSPFARLTGTDNQIVFWSERYADRPLVVTGPGAGAEVTAMGVLGDILRVAAERR